MLEKGNWGLDSEERVLDTGQAKNKVPLLFPLSSLLTSGLLTTFLQENVINNQPNLKSSNNPPNKDLFSVLISQSPQSNAGGAAFSVRRPEGTAQGLRLLYHMVPLCRDLHFQLREQGGKSVEHTGSYGHTQMVYRVSAHTPLVRTQSLVPTPAARDAGNIVLFTQRGNEWGLRDA